jgi:diaminopimelate decarboxylase
MLAVDLTTLTHVLPDTSRVTSEGHLEVGGCDSVALAGQFGTPLYVFCEETLRNRCRAFLSAFRSRHPDTSVVYASKAYINPTLANIVREEGLGLDIVSGGELALAKAVRFPGSDLYFHGNNKTLTELEEALDYGVGRVVLDNFQELDLLAQIAAAKGITQPVLIRVTPGIDPHTHAHTTTGVLDSKFGFPIATGQAKEAILRALGSPALHLVGLHFHLGSPIFELEPYAAAVKIVLKFAAELTPHGFHLEEFSPGGGFAIAYLRSQHPPTPDAYASVIVETLQRECEFYNLPLPHLVVEPGRAIVGPACLAIYQVGAIKEIPGVRTYVAVDGGMGDNIRPALYDAQYEVIAVNRMDEEPTQRVTVAGKYCESGDILARDATLPDLESGDLIALPSSGAYCPSLASTYNMNPLPAVVIARNGQARLARRRQTYQDLMRNDLFGPDTAQS